MGYRSFGVLAISKETYFKHKHITDLLPTDALAEFVETNHEEGTNIYWAFTDWKWYQMYSTVQAVENFMDHLDEEEIDQGSDSLYGFMRVGEDDGDIERRGDPYEFDLQLNIDIAGPMDWE